MRSVDRSALFSSSTVFFVVARWFVIESNISSNSYRTVFWPFMKDKSERKILFFNFLFLFLAWIYLRLVYLYRYQTDCECQTKIHSHRPSKKPALTFIPFAKTVKHFSTKGVYFAFVTVALRFNVVPLAWYVINVTFKTRNILWNF